MAELFLMLAFAGVFWPGVRAWVRYLNTRDLLEGLHPTAADVAAIEATLPQFGDPR